MSVHVVPRIGTNVIVGHLGTGIERGVVLSTVPTQNGGAVIPDHLNTAAVLMDDGTQISHNPETGALQVVGPKTVLFAVGGDIAFHSDGVWTINCSGNCNVTAGGNANVTAANVTVTGGTITLQGNVHVTGSLTVDQNINGNADENISGNSYSGSRTGGPI
jgi:phage baseplate assembly protein gpV